jgi:hypothetical protein
MKEQQQGLRGARTDDKAAAQGINLTMNPLFGRGTLAKHSAGRVYHVDKENITNDSINDVIVRDFTPIKSPGMLAPQIMQSPVVTFSLLTPPPSFSQPTSPGSKKVWPNKR